MRATVACIHELLAHVHLGDDPVGSFQTCGDESPGLHVRSPQSPQGGLALVALSGPRTREPAGLLFVLPFKNHCSVKHSARPGRREYTVMRRRRRGDARREPKTEMREPTETTSRRASSGERDRQPEIPVHRGPCGPCFGIVPRVRSAPRRCARAPRRAALSLRRSIY